MTTRAYLSYHLFAITSHYTFLRIRCYCCDDKDSMVLQEEELRLRAEVLALGDRFRILQEQLAAATHSEVSQLSVRAGGCVSTIRMMADDGQGRGGSNRAAGTTSQRRGQAAVTCAR